MVKVKSLTNHARAHKTGYVEDAFVDFFGLLVGLFRETPSLVENFKSVASVVRSTACYSALLCTVARGTNTSTRMHAVVKLLYTRLRGILQWKDTFPFIYLF